MERRRGHLASDGSGCRQAVASSRLAQDRARGSDRRELASQLMDVRPERDHPRPIDWPIAPHLSRQVLVPDDGTLGGDERREECTLCRGQPRATAGSFEVARSVVQSQGARRLADDITEAEPGERIRECSRGQARPPDEHDRRQRAAWWRSQPPRVVRQREDDREPSDDRPYSLDHGSEPGRVGVEHDERCIRLSLEGAGHRMGRTDCHPGFVPELRDETSEAAGATGAVHDHDDSHLDLIERALTCREPQQPPLCSCDSIAASARPGTGRDLGDAHVFLDSPSVRLITVAGLLGTLTVSALALVLAFTSAQKARDAAVAALQVEADAAAAEAERYLVERVSTLEVLAASDGLQSGDARVTQLLLDAFPGVVGFQGVSLVGHDGYVRTSSGPLTPSPTYIGDRDYVQDVLRTGRPSVGAAVVGRVSGVPTLPIGVPFSDPLTGESGVLIAGIALGAPGTLEFGLTPSVVILGRVGRIIVAPGSPDRLLQEARGWSNYERVRSAERGSFRGAGIAGAEDSIVAFAGVPTGQWVVLVERPAPLVFAEADARFRQEAGAIGVFFLTTTAALIFLTRRIEQHQRGEVEAREQVERELQAREQFVRSLVHDVRSPLTVIKGAAAFARRKSEDGVTNLLTDIEQAANRIDRMLSDMSIADGNIAVDVSEVNATRLLYEVVRAAQADDPTRQYVVSVSDEIVGWWDVDLIRRAIENLLSNARKYSRQGTVIILSAHRTEGFDEISVRDDGQGIPAADLPFIFEPYRRGSDTGGTPGMGLGLANVANIVRLHEGTVSAESRLGHGTTITMRLPHKLVSASR